MPRTRICPVCSSSRVSRSQKRGFIEKVLFTITGIRPYRCLNCDSRFFRRGSAHEARMIGAERQQ